LFGYYTCPLIFAAEIEMNMAHNQPQETTSHKAFGSNWVKSSRFLFYLQVATLLAFVAGCSGYLYSTSYKGKPKVEVPESTQYTPKYKS
jgi:hypothetical protein